MAQARPFDHLKRHVPTNVALLATVVSAAMPVLSATFLAVPHGYTAARSHPAYWLSMAPLAIWVWGAISFDGWAVRLIAPLMVAAPVLAGVVALLSRTSGPTPWCSGRWPGGRAWLRSSVRSRWRGARCGRSGRPDRDSARLFPALGESMT